MGKLTIIYGPMFAGKTLETIRRIKQCRNMNITYMVVKPSIDNRNSELKIVSHNLQEEKCIPLNKLNDIFDTPEFINSNTIFIDEGQFFDDLYDIVIKMVEQCDKNVIVSGLLVDYNRQIFGSILKLIPFSDESIQLHSLCSKCVSDEPGIFSHRDTNVSNQILVGGSDMYTTLCRKHFIKLN